MAHRKTGKKLARVNGVFRRTIGQFRNASGKIAPKRFILGRDRRHAEAANARLELLWDQIEQEAIKRHEHATRFSPPSHELPPILWEGVELEIAEAIRRGEMHMEMDHQNDVAHKLCADGDPIGYATHIHYMNQHYGHVMRFVPANEELLRAGQERHADLAHHRLRLAQNAASIAELDAVPGTGQTVYAAIDAYADHAARQRRPEHAKSTKATVFRLKNAITDRAIESIGYDAIQAIGDYWRSRPPSQRPGAKGEPIAIDTVANMCKLTSRFLRWLDRSDQWSWQAPRHFEEALKVNKQTLRSDQERLKLAGGPETWTIEELAALYRNATDRERVLLLFGLNFGFTQTEILSLRGEDFVKRAGRTLMRRVRHKTHVYYEAAVWPETQSAIRWLTSKKSRLGHADQPYLWSTARGSQATTQSISNAWGSLLNRTHRNDEQFTRRLSFGKLRKTAGQLVREASDGETAGVFLAHGTPVPTDNLLDVYTRRVFDRVFVANDRVHETLAPMFHAAPEAFRKPRRRGSPNITKSQIQKIKSLAREGTPATEIARLVGVSRQTVYRHRPTEAA